MAGWPHQQQSLLLGVLLTVIKCRMRQTEFGPSLSQVNPSEQLTEWHTHVKIHQKPREVHCLERQPSTGVSCFCVSCWVFQERTTLTAVYLGHSQGWVCSESTLRDEVR